MQSSFVPQDHPVIEIGHVCETLDYGWKYPVPNDMELWPISGEPGIETVRKPFYHGRCLTGGKIGPPSLKERETAAHIF